MQTDLFGFEIAKPTVRSSAPREVKPAIKLVFDRKALWSSSGFLPGAKEVDEDDIAKAVSTSDTRSDNATLERVEAALGLKPLVKDGQWVHDELGFKYRRVGKPFFGSRRFGEKGSLLWDLNRQLTLRTARDAIEPLFTNPCNWLIVNAISVLSIRLRMMDADEDHMACLTAFLNVMAQHDFIDNSRKGETIRSLTKRDQMRSSRAAQRAKKQKETPAVVEDVVEVQDVKEAEIECTSQDDVCTDHGEQNRPILEAQQLVSEPDENEEIDEDEARAIAQEAEERAERAAARKLERQAIKALMKDFESDDDLGDFDDHGFDAVDFL